MLSNKESAAISSLIEALDEPAFVFEADGSSVCCNMHGQKMMDDGSLPFRDPLNLQNFSEIIDRLLPIDGTEELILAGQLYAYDCRPFSGGVLVRFHALGEREHILRISASLDNMPWGILTLDVSGEFPRVVYKNNMARRIIAKHIPGATPEDGLSILHSFGIHEDIGSHIYGQKVSYYTFEKWTKSGDSFWFRLHFIPYARRRNYCLIVLEDVTDSKRREGKYVQSQRLEALGQLAGGVAHDFNNILSIIDGYARMGRKSISDATEADACLEKIMSAVDRAAAITTQLLAFGSHTMPHGEVHDLGHIIEENKSLLLPLIDASIVLRVDVKSDLWVDATPDQICQILINLCVNARDAMPDGGDLIVETGRRGDAVVYFRVIDTGRGMDQSTKAKMFDPFFTTKDKGKGTGLGLSVVYGLVKEMHGEIDVITEPGAGTSITIWLPRAQAGEKTEAGLEEDRNIFLFKGATILVVEDEPDLLDILIKSLSDIGANVLSASNGREALIVQKEFSGKIDILLTDVVMPEMNGVKMSGLLLQDRPETKIIFMSGYPAEGDAGRIILPPQAMSLSKPIKMDSLIPILNKIVKRDARSGVVSNAVPNGSRAVWT